MKNRLTYEYCQKTALKFKYPQELCKYDSSAYAKIMLKGWVELFSHMSENPSSKGYWTLDRCTLEAKKYKHKIDFKKNSPAAYSACLNNKWIGITCKHMISLCRRNFWTREKCFEAAKTCYSRTDFINKFPGAKRHADKFGFYQELVETFPRIGNDHVKYIYFIELPNEIFYVGLTSDIHRRSITHQTNSSNAIIRDHVKRGTKLIVHCDGVLYPAQEAATLEIFYIEVLKAEGVELANLHKGGALGTNKKIWTREACREKALLCKTKQEFKTRFKAAASSAYKSGWIDFVCSHFEQTRNPDGFWTEENLIARAKMYTDFKEFRTKEKAAYMAISKKKLHDKALSHFKRQIAKRGTYTKEYCIELVKQFKLSIQFKNSHPCAYAAMLRNGWREEVLKFLIEE